MGLTEAELVKWVTEWIRETNTTELVWVLAYSKWVWGVVRGAKWVLIYAIPKSEYVLIVIISGCDYSFRNSDLITFSYQFEVLHSSLCILNVTLLFFDSTLSPLPHHGDPDMWKSEIWSLKSMFLSFCPLNCSKVTVGMLERILMQDVLRNASIVQFSLTYEVKCRRKVSFCLRRFNLFPPSFGILIGRVIAVWWYNSSPFLCEITKILSLRLQINRN